LDLLRAAIFAAILAAAAAGATPGRAVEAINVRSDVTAIDLTGVADLIKTETDRIQVSAAPGADGIVRRMQQPAREGSTNWAVFALANSGDEQIDRLIVVVRASARSSNTAPPPTSTGSRSIPAR
jgi:hypothetical protein